MILSGLVGRLLVASPMLHGSEFHRTVILMLDHDEEGSLGVVLNRPMHVGVEAVLPDWQPYVTQPGWLYHGGPVAKDSAIGLASVVGDDPSPSGVQRLVRGLGLVDLDCDPGAVAGGVGGLRIFAGYAGWSAGQLADEAAQGAWFIVDAETRDGFTDEPEELWAGVLRRQGGDLGLVARYPADPALN